MIDTSNISPDWRGTTRAERTIGLELVKRENTPQAIVYLAKHCSRVGSYTLDISIAARFAIERNASEIT
jgi:hypothetical protein